MIERMDIQNGMSLDLSLDLRRPAVSRAEPTTGYLAQKACRGLSHQGKWVSGTIVPQP